MRHILLIATLALLPACAQIETAEMKAVPYVNAGLKSVNAGVAKADAFVTAKIAPTVNAGNSWLVATIGPYLDIAAHAFFCNKYAQSSCAGK